MGEKSKVKQLITFTFKETIPGSILAKTHTTAETNQNSSNILHNLIKNKTREKYSAAP